MQMDIGKWYEFQGLSVRRFEGRNTLTTTKNSRMIIVDRSESVVDIEPMDVEVISGLILGTDLEDVCICPQQHVLEDLSLSASRVRCLKCNIFYKVGRTEKLLKWKISIELASWDIRTINVEHKT